MRDKRTDRMLVDVANTGLGDAMLFRISEHLVHRITPVEGDAPKTAFAGWFEAGPSSMVSRMLSS
jgi:hypothetical protein